jgi:hypothetical protein
MMRAAMFTPIQLAVIAQEAAQAGQHPELNIHETYTRYDAAEGGETLTLILRSSGNRHITWRHDFTRQETLKAREGTAEEFIAWLRERFPAVFAPKVDEYAELLKSAKLLAVNMESKLIDLHNMQAVLVTNLEKLEEMRNGRV